MNKYRSMVALVLSNFDVIDSTYRRFTTFANTEAKLLNFSCEVVTDFFFSAVDTAHKSF